MDKGTFRLVCLGFLSFICASVGFSYSLHRQNWFFGVGAGLAWPGLSKSATGVANGGDDPAPYNFDRYSIKTSGANAGLMVFAGYRWERAKALFPFYSLALRYQYLSASNIKGEIQQYSLPQFTNYSYRLRGSSNIFTLQGKLGIYQFHSLTPYLGLGLGVASNNIRGYQEQPYSGIIPRVSPGYQDKTLTRFAYNLGFGLDYTINSRLTASIGYEYANLGKVRSGDGVSTWSGESLSLGRLSAHTVMLSLTCRPILQ